jgi:hypothetical protein
MQRYRRILLAWIVLTGSATLFAGTSFKATTTLSAQTGNNTSAANTFTTLSDDDLGAGNISKVSIHTLLYSGSTAKVYVHFMPWFGFSNHMNVGYSSDDSAQVQRQLNDMVSRGIDGIIVDWYGQGTTNSQLATYSQVVSYFMQDIVAQQPAFTFAVTDDAGSLQACAATAGCDLTQTVINDLTYAYNTWETSPAYLHYNNQPVVFFFGEESYPTLDWTQIRASVPGNPLFIFRNSVGFNYAESNGAFSWVAPETVSTTDPMALGYLDNFDQTAVSLSPAYSIESGYKGFNDSLASWGTGRLIQQQCGQTWLTSMAESNKYYSATRQMLGFQIVTWNDYEEGTEIESGIDNCATISALAKGTVVNWSLTGQANTVDHYAVYLSQDGENLMWLANVPVSTSSLDLAPFQMDPGNYMVFVQAVGKASLANHMAESLSVTIPGQGSAFTFSGSNSSATVNPGQTATYNLALATGGSGFTGTVALACSGAPEGTTCSVNPGSVSLSSTAVSASVTVSVATTQQAHSTPILLRGLPFTFAAIFAGLLLKGPKRRSRMVPLAGLAVFLVCGLIGCAGGASSSTSSAPPQPTPAPSPGPTPGSPTSATLTITGTSGSQTATATLNLTITQ